MMRRLAVVLVALALAGAGVVACGDNSTAPKAVTYSLIFQRDSATQSCLVGISCGACTGPYCYTMGASAGQFTGSLTMEQEAPDLTLGMVLTTGTQFLRAYYQPWTHDSLWTTVADTGRGCGRMDLHLLRSGASITGRFIEYLDCHGSLVTGSVTGS